MSHAAICLQRNQGKRHHYTYWGLTDDYLAYNTRVSGIKYVYLFGDKDTYRRYVMKIKD